MSKVKILTKGNTESSIDSESEYFFDDQFIIPFDANLKEENNNYTSNDMALEINGNNYNKIQSLCQSYSESCIYSDLDSSYHQFPDILDDLFDKKKIKKNLFTPSQSNSEGETKDSMHRSSLLHSSILKELLNKQSGRDYRITFEEKANINNKTNSLNNSSFGYDDNDNSVGNKMTWNQINNKDKNSLLKLNLANVTNVSTNVQSTTWRQLKDNASKKLISWNKLKNQNDDLNICENIVENNSRGRSIVKSNNVLNEKSNSFIKFRAHSEPRKSYRFSGTLLEIFSRTRGLNQIKNSDESFDIFKYENENINIDKNKILVNFGAQFPPTNGFEYHYRNRSNSLLDRKSQKYPGLGLINTPKYLRLTDTVFLSKTLPDLSFLAKDRIEMSSDNQNLKRTKFSKDSGFDSSNNDKLKDSHLFCKKCQTVFKDAPITNDLINFEGANIMGSNHYRSVPNFNEIDLLTGSPIKTKFKNQKECAENDTPLKSCLRQSMDRSISEPDFGNTKSEKMNEDDDESNSSNNSDQECYKSNKAKKSVSFSEKLFKSPLSPLKAYGSSLTLWQSDLNQNTFNKPQEIPRDLGLYGNESVMISEFALGAQLKYSKENEVSNEDLKYKVMIRDIIKAVQETIAIYSQQPIDNKNLADKKIIMPCLCIVEPLHILLIDGILPYPKNITSIKSRHRLWNVIESSCINVDYMVEIMKSVKKIPIMNEKNRFKSLISHLIKEKLMKKWFKDLLKNESVLKNNYSKESFLRQCKTCLKGLYADLETNLQLLDSLPNSSSNITQTNKATISKPITSVKSLKKTNSGINQNYFQDSNIPQLNAKEQSNVKKNRSNLSSKSFNNLSNSTTLSSSILKKPLIYYPKYSVAKGKI